QEIADKLIQDGYNADSLHGELSQAQRDYVMQKFRVKNIQLLVATDVAARGLDVDDLTHVINYGLPDEVESYTHRSGRTGRAGKTGISIAICHIKEKGRIRDIERIINKKFDKGEMPSGQAICEKQLLNLVDQIEKVKVNEEEISPLMPAIYRKLEWLEKEDIIKRMVSLEFNRLIDYYKDAQEIQDVTDDRFSRKEFGEGDRGGRRVSLAQEGYSRLFLNFGKTDGLYPNQLIELINKCVPGKVQIGKIDLRDNFSFFEVESAEANRVIQSMCGFEIEGRRISVEPAQGKKEGGDRGPRGGGEYKGRRDRKDFGDRKEYGSRSSYGNRREESGDKPWRRNSEDRNSRKPSNSRYRR
ncbi:helicase-related protein, partial [Macellibacteroides fermentans]|uniref:helicase-related protein n=3 Tax=Porphyromonadaceae TaxID=171551 RepID=UPI002D0A1890|nr:helicase-related protein [Macellibacteroides fermentans]